MNINRFLMPNDIITNLTTIYRYIGKNEQYLEIVGSDFDRIVEQTIERDSYFLSKILNLDISDARMRLIITKNSTPRAKDENTLYNLKEMLTSFQKQHSDVQTQSNDLINMINYIFPSINIKYDFVFHDKKIVLRSQEMKSKRVIIDEINEEVKSNLLKGTFEPIVLLIHYFIDFYNLEPFTVHNHEASLLILYLSLLKANVYAFQYVSLFELIFNDYDTFITELKNASFNWKEGLSQTLGFVRYMTKCILSAYNRTHEIINEYSYDQNINKSNNIENTILKLSTVFTKEEIRLVHPYVSESTINRTLSKMREDKVIKPLGKGRSAKWIKL